MVTAPLALPEIHQGRSDFGHVSEHHYVFYFMRHAIAHVNRAWRSRADEHTPLDEICSIAIEELVKVANGYPEWAQANNVDPYAGGIFWTNAKQFIDWRIGVHFRDRKVGKETSLEVMTGDDPAAEDGAHEDLVRTQLINYRPPSILLPQLAGRLAEISPRDLAIIALYYFEEMSTTAMEPILGMTNSAMGKRIVDVATRVHEWALALVLDEYFVLEPMRRPKGLATIHSDTLRKWTQDHYAVEPDKYLEYVLVCFRSDVSYLIDMLDRANGILTSHQRPKHDGCTIGGCKQPTKARGLCTWHYTLSRDATRPRCNAADCDKPVRARGLCGTHYKADRRRHIAREALGLDA